MIVVQQEDFDVNALYQDLVVNNETGAVAMFVGLVRDFADQSAESASTPEAAQPNSVFELEHYPGMTEHNLQSIVDDAHARWSLNAVSVVHRVGKLSVQDQIVFVGVSASHREEAFQACDFIMDYLKSRAAFWKKETQGEHSRWVEANEKDAKSLSRWA